MSARLERSEFPRPDFVREDWMSLNGEWEFQFDQENAWTVQMGLNGQYEDKIQVPFCYQSRMSGIGKTEDCPAVWYRRSVSLQEKPGKKVLLKFGAVDYKAYVWVNGIYIGNHEGGHISFSMDITDAVTDGENVIVVKAEDYLDADKPRGKQSWTGEQFGCWYIPTTGIWQSVWLEYVPEVYLEKVKITPDLKALTAVCELFLSSHEETVCSIRPHMVLGSGGHKVNTVLEAGKYEFGRQQVICRNGYGKAVIAFRDFDLRRDIITWSPEHPNLIDVDICVGEGGRCDQVYAYLGMRSISREKDQILLNEEVYFQRLVLDQGYWEESLLTPPSKEALVKDLELAKAMGFNGVRKHQKIEDPQFYYQADRMGLLVWGELPSAYEFNDNMIKRSIAEMTAFVERDYNHPCIVAWVPVNESWGVRDIQEDKQQQDYARAMTYLLKALDKNRLVSSNDGWEQPDCTDICAIHDYIYTPAALGKYKDLEKVVEGAVETRCIFAKNQKYSGQPVMLTEYGGIAFDNGDDNGWGYLGKVKDEEEFLNRLGPVTEEIIKSRQFAGYCYTQLTDVQQEVNGLLTADRKPKVPVEKLRKIFAMKFYE